MREDELTFVHRVPCDTSAAWRARDFVIDLGLPHGRFLESMLLLVSELVTNALRRPEGRELRLAITVGPGRVRAEVRPEPPGATHEPIDDEGDRYGPMIIERLAAASGVESDGAAPIAWFELTRATGHEPSQLLL